MARYKNEKALELLGKRIKTLRKAKDLEIEDISEMTGISNNTIRNIEAGSEVSLSYFLEICFALGDHPKKVLDVPLAIEPRYRLSETRKEKSRLTARLHKYLTEGFFDEEKTAAEVVQELYSDYNLETSSSAVSVILKRFTKQNLLKSKMLNHKNFYFISKRTARK